MNPVIRHGAAIWVREEDSKTTPIKGEATAWDRAYDVRVGVRGIELVMSTDEARAFCNLILDAVRRAEKRKKERPPAPIPPPEVKEPKK